MQLILPSKVDPIPIRLHVQNKTRKYVGVEEIPPHGNPEYSRVSPTPSPPLHRDGCLSRQLHYFLEDDTIEIRSLRGPNSGRDRFPVMLRRGKIPKSFSAGDAGDVYHWKDFGIGIEASPPKVPYTSTDTNLMPKSLIRDNRNTVNILRTCVHIFTRPLEQYTPWNYTPRGSCYHTVLSRGIFNP